MNISVNIEKEHLAFLIVSLVVVSWFGLAVAANPGVSHTADEIYIGTETLQEAVDTSRGSVLVRHSQTTTVPTCPSGWTELWNGYSFMSAFLHAGYEAPQSLGNSGSCLKEFRPVPHMECGGDGGYTNRCDYATDGDYSMWLSTRTTDEGPVTGTAPEFTDVKERISRCVVCYKRAPVLVMHSQTTTVPTCPSGWTELWNGYSLMSAFLHQSYPAEQDLGSPGSCLSEFRAIPHIECGGTGGHTNYCDYATGGDYSMWLSTRTSDEGPITSGLEERVSRCVVCSK